MYKKLTKKAKILNTKIDSGIDPLAENKEEEVKKEIVDDENDF